MPFTSATEAVWTACCTITGKDEGTSMDKNASLFDMGLDSLGLAELVIQLEELYGEGAITIDDVLSNPVVCEVAAMLPDSVNKTSGTAAAPAKKTQAPPAKTQAPPAK